MGSIIKLNNFGTAKETIIRVKQTTHRGIQISTVSTYDKGLISRICKEFKQISKKKTIPSKNGLRT